MTSPFVQVFGQTELVTKLKSGAPVGSHLISIGNPKAFWRLPRVDERLPPEFRGRFEDLLRLAFFDLPDTSDLRWDQPKRIPQTKDVEAVVRFVRRTRSTATGFTLHCWAGVSRSTAMALGVLFLLTGSEESAARELIAIRRTATPHPGLVRCWDEVMGSHLADVSDVLREERLREMRREVLAAVQRGSTQSQGDSEVEELP
jgi:predicted protein tyrosine phosphatase